MTITMTPTAAPAIATSPANIAKFQDRSGHFIASLEIEMFRAQRYARPLSVISVEAVAVGRHRNDDAELPHRRLYLDRRLRQAAPEILRMPDFWGRHESGPFLFVLPETELPGAAAVAGRIAATSAFQAMLEQDNGRSLITLGAAQYADATPTSGDLLAAAQSNPVWRSDAMRAAL